VAEQPADWRELDRPGIRLLAQMVDTASAYPGITTGALAERWRGTEDESAVRKLADARLIALIPEDGRAPELLGIIARLNRDAAAERRAADIDRRWRARDGDSDTTG